MVTTHAGSAFGPYSTVTVDGSGSNAFFAFPYSVAVDASGSIFVADTLQPPIRKMTADGGTRIGPVTLHARISDSHVRALEGAVQSNTAPVCFSPFHVFCVSCPLAIPVCVDVFN